MLGSAVPSARSRIRIDGARRLHEVIRGVGVEIRRQREDQGVGQATIARAAGLSPAHLCAIESGASPGSLGALANIASALGARLDVRIVPSSGTPLRDHLQAAMVEAFIRVLHPAWGRHLEVPVQYPVRGVIDVVLVHRDRPLVVAIEAQSEIRRLEQQLRWANEKARALLNSEIVAAIREPDVPPPRVHQVLLLRSTAATRDLARRFEATLATAYPARAFDVWRALTGEAPWPGSGVVWVRVDRGQASIFERPPWGVRLGR